MNADQQLFCKRLDISDEALALACQTCGVREYIESRVEVFGSTNIYGRHESGKGVTRYSDEFQRLWPKEKRGKK